MQRLRSNLPPPSSSLSRKRIVVLAWAALFTLLAAALQAATRAPADPDTAYHFAVGRLIREHGILHAFPWTPFSILATQYADKELVFHLAFVPVAGLDWILASKIVGGACAALSLLLIYLVLRHEQTPLAGLWAVLPFGLSAVFVFRFGLVRPHVLAVGLAIVALWAASRRRLAIVALVAAVFPWVHVTWPLVLVLAIVSEIAHVAAGERPRAAPFLVALAGLAAGLLLHPNGLNLLRVHWIHLSDVLVRNIWAERPGFDMGNEFRQFQGGEWLRYMLLPATSCILAAVFAWRGRRGNPVPIAFAIASVGFGVLTVRSARFMELLAPFAAAALALTLGRRAWWWLAAPTVAAAAAFTWFFGQPTLRGLVMQVDRVPPAVAEQLAEAIPIGSQVFTCNWGYTGEYLRALPDRRWIVALDPTLFHAKAPGLYDLWFALPRDPPPDAAQLVREAFGARFVLCEGRGWEPFYRQLLRDRSARMLYHGAGLTLLDLEAAPR